MTPEEQQACQRIAETLASKKYKDKNYMFLAPFDLSQTPGYMDVVTKVMDLSTLNKNAATNFYSTKEQFFQDAAMVFDNAIAYHTSRETKWIAKLARDMLKVLARERKAIETKKVERVSSKSSVGFISKKRSVDGTAKIKLKLGSASGRSTPTAQSTTQPSSAISMGKAPGKVLPTSVPVLAAKSKPAASGRPVSSSKPKISLKLKGPKASSKAKTAALAMPIASASVTTEEPKPKKRRLTLKLKPKMAATAAPAVPSTTKLAPVPAQPSAVKPPPAKVSTPTKPTSTPKNSVKLSAPSRGKELPKGVVTTPTKPVTPSTSAKGKTLPTSATSSTPTKSKPSTKPTIKLKTSAATGASKTSSGTTKKAVTKKSKTPKDPNAKKTTTKKASAKKASAAAAAAAGPITPPPVNRGMMFMTPPRRGQCAKVLSGLKRRKHSIMTWFLQPVSDKNIVQDYRKKIPFPMDVSSMQSKLDKNQYATIAQFALDLRRIFSNCLRYNYNIKDPLRNIAKDALAASEELMLFFLAKAEYPNVVYPPILYCWRQCLGVLDTLLSMTNTQDGQPTALYFVFPVSFYCGGQFPPDYLSKVTKPMDLGTVTANLIEGTYTNVDAFTADCQLVLENCNTYYGAQKDGKLFVEQANRLKDVLQQQIESLNRDLNSPPGLQLRARAAVAVQTASLPQPPPILFLGILSELRITKYTDKATKITEPATAPFEQKVSLAAFPDYMQYVQVPMDLQTVERQIKAGAYTVPEDFEYDVSLVFYNAIAYNTPRKSDHFVAMAKYALKHFRKSFTSKMRPFDDPEAVAKENAAREAQRRLSLSSATGSQGPSKKIKIETSSISKGKSAPKSSTKTAGKTSPKNTPKSTTAKATAKAAAKTASKSAGKSAPRISLSLSSAAKTPSTAVAPAPPAPARSKAKLPTSNKAKLPQVVPASNQPVPLHIAIARVKEGFPVRRNIKTLQSWEAICARYFKELMRHPWISAARPKFIFHVPVPSLFPGLQDAYASKIKDPMDLTTVECKLLAGGRYTGPEDFMRDVALIFSNAITFNKDGKDVGDPLSCAYYDASLHLLKYSRWLSLEQFIDYVEDNDYVDDPDEVSHLPPTSWKLTSGNRKKAREEMTAIVLGEPLERSLEGDRYTWMEAECEKLLKALRHQSDLRYMTFFIQPNYPPDYAAFIPKPMDWEKVQKTLKKRQYDKFGSIIEDLRLIFTNASKYNARHQGTETVSGRAFDAAKYMSAKLESSINKMMLTVSDRLERERIDHNNAEREIEAADRAEDERIRAQWKTENKDAPPGTEPLRTERSQVVRSNKRSNFRRASDADFEVPFFDDADDGHHERSYLEVVREQKAMFVRQQQNLKKMRATAASVGAKVFLRHQQTELAEKWLAEELEKIAAEQSETGETPQVVPNATIDDTKVLDKIEDPNRQALKITLLTTLSKSKAGKKKKTKSAFSFD